MDKLKSLGKSRRFWVSAIGLAAAVASDIWNAATNAASAESAKNAAEAARDATLAAYDSFDDRYLGANSTEPTLDNDNNPLVSGSLYFDTTTDTMKLYTGSSWVAAYVTGTGVIAASGGTMTGNLSFGDNNKASALGLTYRFTMMGLIALLVTKVQVN